MRIKSKFYTKQIKLKFGFKLVLCSPPAYEWNGVLADFVPKSKFGVRQLKERSDTSRHRIKEAISIR